MSMTLSRSRSAIAKPARDELQRHHPVHPGVGSVDSIIRDQVSPGFVALNPVNLGYRVAALADRSERLFGVKPGAASYGNFPVALRVDPTSPEPVLTESTDDRHNARSTDASRHRGRCNNTDRVFRSSDRRNS